MSFWFPICMRWTIPHHVLPCPEGHCYVKVDIFVLKVVLALYQRSPNGDLSIIENPCVTIILSVLHKLDRSSELPTFVNCCAWETKNRYMNFTPFKLCAVLTSSNFLTTYIYDAWDFTFFTAFPWSDVYDAGGHIYAWGEMKKRFQVGDSPSMWKSWQPCLNHTSLVLL